MEELVKKYLKKLYLQGLVDNIEEPLFGGLNASMYWNKKDALNSDLEDITAELGVNSILFSKPAEPYFSIMNFLAGQNNPIISKDSETRLFLKDLPVLKTFDKEKIIQILKSRKCLVILNEGILSYGSLTPEYAFVFYSSACFAMFVKFFADYYISKTKNKSTEYEETVFQKVKAYINHLPAKFPQLSKGPFEKEEEIYKAISEAGLMTVDYKLVDCYFGNISFRKGSRLYITQTGSALEELDGYIDPCTFDGSTCNALSASSEFYGHKNVYLQNGELKTILHGHPKFSVIMSMACNKKECYQKDLCHTACPEKRSINNIPIVSGEVGSGVYGLSNTIPPELKRNKGVIVFGHGVFTAGKEDFNEPFQSLLEIEKMCMEEYFKALDPKI